MIQNQFQTSVKTFRSDNGFEFLSKDFQDVMNNFGILHQKSCIYTPQ